MVRENQSTYTYYLFDKFEHIPGFCDASTPFIANKRKITNNVNMATHVNVEIALVVYVIKFIKLVGKELDLEGNNRRSFFTRIEYFQV